MIIAKIATEARQEVTSDHKKTNIYSTETIEIIQK